MLSNGVPIGTVSKLLGYSKLTTTQVYARVVKSKISEDLQNHLSRFETKEHNRDMKKLKIIFFKAKNRTSF
ncbi:site-specific integrase [Snuella sedimenti]|uniref:hypothetical protein n=1 Tax=Snuella sedimenti TaxID=2798802 RepID=UPI003743DC96